MAATDQGGGRVEFGVADAVPEKGTFPYVLSLYDDAGVALLASAVSTITATLVAPLGGATVFTGRNVKNTNGGTLTDGSFALVLSGTDLALQADETSNTYAERRLTLVITATGTGGVSLPLYREVVFFLRNLRDVA